MDLFLMDLSKNEKTPNHNGTFDRKDYAATRGKENVYCKVCDKEVSYYALSKHNKSKTHLKNELENNEQTKKERDELYSKVKNNMKTFNDDLNKLDTGKKKEQDKEIDNYLKLSKKIKAIDDYATELYTDLDIAYNGILDIMNQWRENKNYIDEESLKDLNKLAKKVIKLNYK